MFDIEEDPINMPEIRCGNESFIACLAFERLYCDLLYAIEDILQFNCFWCDVSLTHQRIVDRFGELQ